MLIESLKSEGAIIRVKEKFRKAIRKVEKDISALNN
jgi:hypothetical protein